MKPITLKVAVYEGDEPVTNIETVTFDSTSDEHGRAEEVGDPDPAGSPVRQKQPYRLVLRDADTGIEQQSVDVTIDRAFTDDF